MRLAQAGFPPLGLAALTIRTIFNAMSLLRRLFGVSDPVAAFTAPLLTDAPVFVIGDLHGCARQFHDLRARMQAQNPTAAQVYVGDYIDRGGQSREVLAALYALRDDPDVICLRGNHEDMMLRFLQEPAAKGPRWLRYGGLDTLASFGIDGIPTNSEPEVFVATATRLEQALGAQMIDWLNWLPTQWQSGNLAVVHAAADPALPMAEQADQTLKWGHKDFLRVPRTDGMWIAHGHTIVEEASAVDGRIAVDTGAYATGRLTAAYIAYGEVQFLQAG